MTTPDTLNELTKLNPSSIIELFEVNTFAHLHGSCEIYRFHAGVNKRSVYNDLIWNGNIYAAWPVEAEGFEYTGTGSLPRPKVRIANVDGLITIALLELSQFAYATDLGGAKVTRIRTLARFLDAENFPDNKNPFGEPDPTSKMADEIYYIDRKSAETREVVEFELAAAFDLAGVRAPKRQTINNACQWKYRSPECGYAGENYFDENENRVSSIATDVCGKRLVSCETRFGNGNPLPFGGFPGVGPYG